MTDDKMHFRGNLLACVSIALVASTIAAIMMLTPSRADANDELGAAEPEDLLRGMVKAIDSRDPAELVRLSGGERLAGLTLCSSDDPWDELDAELEWMRKIRRVTPAASSVVNVDAVPELSHVAKGDVTLDCTASRSFEVAFFFIPRQAGDDTSKVPDFVTAYVVDDRWYLATFALPKRTLSDTELAEEAAYEQERSRAYTKKRRTRIAKLPTTVGADGPVAAVTAFLHRDRATRSVVVPTWRTLQLAADCPLDTRTKWREKRRKLVNRATHMAVLSSELRGETKHDAGTEIAHCTLAADAKRADVRVTVDVFDGTDMDYSPVLIRGRWFVVEGATFPKQQ